MGARNKRTRTANDMRGLEISDMSHYPWCLNQGRPLRRKNPLGIAREFVSARCCKRAAEYQLLPLQLCRGSLCITAKSRERKNSSVCTFSVMRWEVPLASVVVIFSRVYVRFPDVVNIYGLDNIVYLQRTITQWINC